MSVPLFVLIREWIRQHLIPFAEKNPDLQIETQLKRSKHPALFASYVNGNSKDIGIKNLSVEDINSFVMDLRNQVGRKVVKRRADVEVPWFKPHNIEGKPTNSVQGEWHEHVNLIDVDFEIEHVNSK